jgi:hypothetical protein
MRWGHTSSIFAELQVGLTFLCDYTDKVKAAMYIIDRMIVGSGIVFCIVYGSAMLGELS